MIKNFLDDENGAISPRETETPRPTRQADPTVLSLFDSVEEQSGPADDPYLFASHPAESAAENIRRTGMAWSMGVAFFSAVLFMLILGWGADLLLGTAPWGVVIGIVLGSLIGFFQLFRLSSQIFKK